MLAFTVYSHVKAYPGHTYGEIAEALSGWCKANYRSRNSIGSTLSNLAACGLLTSTLPEGKERGGTYAVAAQWDHTVYAAHRTAVAAAVRTKKKTPKAVGQASIFPAAKAADRLTIVHLDREKLRDLTRRYARARPYTDPNSKLIHQSLLDLLSVTNLLLASADTKVQIEVSGD